MHYIIGIRQGNTGLQLLTKRLMGDFLPVFSDISCDIGFKLYLEHDMPTGLTRVSCYIRLQLPW